MKLILLLLALNGTPDADHLLRMRTAELHFMEHIAANQLELDRAIKSRQAWEAILRIIGKSDMAEPPVQQIQLPPPQPQPTWV